MLFHYDQARAAAGDQVIVVEGFFDCMRVYQAGFVNVVALMGARLSAAQKVLLAARFTRALLLLDGARHRARGHGSGIRQPAGGGVLSHPVAAAGRPAAR